MPSAVRRQDVQKLVGKRIYAVRKNGTVVTGLLKKLKGNELIVQLPRNKARTSFFIPLVLYDLLAIGTYGSGGYGGYGPYGYSPYKFGPGYGYKPGLYSPYGTGFGYKPSPYGPYGPGPKFF
jgi:hypothetical protein